MRGADGTSRGLPHSDCQNVASQPRIPVHGELNSQNARNINILSPQFQIIRSTPESMFYASWTEVYILNRAQCGSESDFNTYALRNIAHIALQVRASKLYSCLHHEMSHLKQKAGRRACKGSWTGGTSTPRVRRPRRTRTRRKKSARRPRSAKRRRRTSSVGRLLATSPPQHPRTPAHYVLFRYF
jgi:hypothetical protein